MNREQVMSVLYDISLVIGSEVSLKPLLTKTLQRLLYHTSFPTGLVFLDAPGDGDTETIETRLDVAIGDFGFAGQVGQRMVLPSALLRGTPEVREAPELLGALPAATRDYTVYFRLPIDHHGVILLLAPRQPRTELPLTEIFRPVMANLAKAILLCRHNDAYTAELMAEREDAEKSLAESEEKFRSITTVAQDAIMMIDNAGLLAYWNPAAERIFGYSAEEAMGQDLHGLIVPERFQQAFNSGFTRFNTSGEGTIIGKTLEIEAQRKDGNEFPVELSVSALQLKGQWHAVGILRDISTRREAERSLHRANRALKTLSGCNSILVRTDDETRLLHDICELIVNVGGYLSAWVGYVEHDPEKRLHPVASAGIDQDYLDTLDLTWADTPEGQGPASRAVRMGERQLAEDLASDAAYASRRDAVIARGYASAIALPLSVPKGVFGVLKVYADVREAFAKEEIGLLTELAEDLAFGIITLRTRVEHERLVADEHTSAERLRRALLGTIQAVALTVEKRDPYTAGHQQRVARLAVAIAHELNWSADKVEGVRLGAMIHDIGKVYVPSEILSRPGLLSTLEFDIIKCHPRVGYEILQDVEFPWPVAQIVLQHHERLDGSGYPQGLSGEQIIPEARLLAVADVVEAMSANRPYRPAREAEAGLEEIAAHRGTAFDPEVVDACLRLFNERGFDFGE